MDLVNKKLKYSQYDPGYPNFPAVDVLPVWQWLLKIQKSESPRQI